MKTHMTPAKWMRAKGYRKLPIAAYQVTRGRCVKTANGLTEIVVDQPKG